MTDNPFYVKNVKKIADHEVGRIYYVFRFSDKTEYSCDKRGLGHGGYISNVINGYFEPSTEAEYNSQNLNDSLQSKINNQ